MSTEALLDHLRGMVDRKILRRVAAILFHRRAGFSANGMGVWKVPEEEILDTGTRMAAVRGISTATSARPTPTGPTRVFTMAHGRSKEECDAILQSIADEHDLHGADRATLYSSTEYKKIRLHYFTRRLRSVGSRALVADTPVRRRSSTRRAVGLMPGGVNSPGARDALDRPRLPDLHRARRGLRADRRRRATATSTGSAPGAR